VPVPDLTQWRSARTGRGGADPRRADAPGLRLDSRQRSAVGQCDAGIGSRRCDSARHRRPQHRRSAASLGRDRGRTRRHDTRFARVCSSTRPGAVTHAATGSSLARPRTTTGAGPVARTDADATAEPCAESRAGSRTATCAGAATSTATGTASPASSREGDQSVRQGRVPCRVVPGTDLRGQSPRRVHIVGDRVQARTVSRYQATLGGRRGRLRAEGRPHSRRASDD